MLSDSDEVKDDHWYRYRCDCLQVRVSMPFHCRDISGRYRGCHETFASKELFSEHRYRGGCRHPSNLEDFYRKDDIWYKKEPKPEENQEDTPVRSPNSKRSRGVAKRSTSKESDGRTYRVDRPHGPSWE